MFLSTPIHAQRNTENGPQDQGESLESLDEPCSILTRRAAPSVGLGRTQHGHPFNKGNRRIRHRRRIECGHFRGTVYKYTARTHTEIYTQRHNVLTLHFTSAPDDDDDDDTWTAVRATVSSRFFPSLCGDQQYRSPVCSLSRRLVFMIR